MNGYKLMADSYRSAAAEGKINAGEAERKARVYDFLGTCTKEDMYTLVDSSAFNDIIRGYCRLALKQAGVDDETVNNTMSDFHIISAKEVSEV